MIAGGLKCPVEDDIRNDIWIKLLGNAAFNPISALARATMVEIATHQGTRAMVRLMMEETLEIAAARSAASPRSRSTSGSTAPNGSASTRRRCCRTWRRTSRSSST